MTMRLASFWVGDVGVLGVEARVFDLKMSSDVVLRHPKINQEFDLCRHLPGTSRLARS